MLSDSVATANVIQLSDVFCGYEKLLFRINKNCLGPGGRLATLDKWWMNRQMLGLKKKRVVN